MNKSALFLMILRILIVFLIIGRCTSSDKISVDGKTDVADPFPKMILGHRTFKVFRDDNRLGYTFRDEKNQVFAPKLWTGKQSRPKGKGEDRTVTFSRKQALNLKARLPAVGFNARYNGDVRFKLEMKGLKIHELIVPVLNREYHDSPERMQPFIVSMLSAKKIIIKAELKTSSGFKLGSENDIASIFVGNVNYSKKHKGMVAAENAFLGYIVTKPKMSDIKRRAMGEKEIRRLAIFNLKYKSRDSDYGFLSTTMRQKLEQAFQGLSAFEVITDSNRSMKEKAKYHLKGNYQKIGKSLVHINLTLTNTWDNNKLVTKPLSRGIRVKDAEELYALQMKVVEDFVKPLGVKLNKKQKDAIKKVVKQTKKIDLIKKYSVARKLFRRAKYKKAIKVFEEILKQDPEYLDAINFYGITLMRLSRYQDAKKQFERLYALASKKGNKIWEAKAHYSMGRVYISLNKLNLALKHHQAALDFREKKYGKYHPTTSWSYYAVGRVNYQIGFMKGGSRSRGYYYKALKYYNMARKIQEKRYGPNSSSLLAVYSSLAHLYNRFGRKRTALKYYIKCFKITYNKYGSKHPEIATTYLNLGVQYRRLKQYRRGMKYLYRSLKIRKRVFSEYNTNVAICYFHIAHSFYKLNDFQSARIFFENSVRIYKKIFGLNHRDTKNTYSFIGNTYYKEGDDQKAEEFWKKAGWSDTRIKRKKNYLKTSRWNKETHGKIPPDSYIAGKESDGKKLYICRVFHRGSLQIGKIRPGFGGCNIGFKGRELSKRKYQVLTLKKGRWYAGSNGNIPYGSYIAGFYKANPLYICRVSHAGGVHIGKVRPWIKACHFGYGGKELKNPKYQVLISR